MQSQTDMMTKVGLVVVLVLIIGTVISVILFSKSPEEVASNAPVPTERPTATPTTEPAATPEVSPTPEQEVSPTPEEGDVTPTPETNEENVTPTPEEESANGKLQSFIVRASEYKYSPTTLRVEPGTTVEIAFKNDGEMVHDFKIDELNVASPLLNPGDTEVVSFVVPEDAPDSYTYYCSISGHRALGMEGTIEVIKE